MPSLEKAVIAYVERGVAVDQATDYWSNAVLLPSSPRSRRLIGC